MRNVIVARTDVAKAVEDFVIVSWLLIEELSARKREDNKLAPEFTNKLIVSLVINDGHASERGGVGDKNDLTAQLIEIVMRPVQSSGVESVNGFRGRVARRIQLRANGVRHETHHQKC